jgi:hypothetical protein
MGQSAEAFGQHEKHFHKNHLLKRYKQYISFNQFCLCAIKQTDVDFVSMTVFSALTGGIWPTQ